MTTMPENLIAPAASLWVEVERAPTPVHVVRALEVHMMPLLAMFVAVGAGETWDSDARCICGERRNAREVLVALRGLAKAAEAAQPVWFEGAGAWARDAERRLEPVVHARNVFANGREAELKEPAEVVTARARATVLELLGEAEFLTRLHLFHVKPGASGGSVCLIGAGTSHVVPAPCLEGLQASAVYLTGADAQRWCEVPFLSWEREQLVTKLPNTREAWTTFEAERVALAPTWWHTVTDPHPALRWPDRGVPTARLKAHP